MTEIRRFVAKELRELLPPTVFFFVVFHMIALTKAVVLEGYQITPGRSALATLMALTVAKAVLIVDALPFTRAFDRGAMIGSLLWKTCLFGAVAVTFRYLEELIPQIGPHGGVVGAARHLAEELSWPHFWIMAMWLVGSVLAYTFVAEVTRLSGAERVRELLTRTPTGPAGTAER